MVIIESLIFDGQDGFNNYGRYFRQRDDSALLPDSVIETGDELRFQLEGKYFLAPSRCSQF